MATLDVLLSVALGIGLAAAVGMRVFLPLLVMSVAAWSGHLTLAPNFQWLGTTPAMLTLAVAALLEISAYYVPGLDNLLDTIATPTALIAGTVAAAAVMTDLPPLVKWTAAIIAGGGAAGLTQGVTTLLRAKSTLGTGGIGNPIIATGELTGALGLSLLAIVMPIAALVALILFFWLVFRLVRRLKRRRQAAD